MKKHDYMTVDKNTTIWQWQPHFN